jgi:hypothetical protein
MNRFGCGLLLAFACVAIIGCESAKACDHGGGGQVFSVVQPVYAVAQVQRVQKVVVQQRVVQQKVVVKQQKQFVHVPQAVVVQQRAFVGQHHSRGGVFSRILGR